jgi:23S rRNA pseudouridine2605 synthase
MPKPRKKKIVFMSDEKLQKVLAAAGFGSRREMERAIEAGMVSVNGTLATLGCRVKPGDKLLVDGHRYLVPSRQETQEELRVILYNKPEGEICSRNDPEGRPTVYDRLPPLAAGRWISVGRLDFNTSGLLLFTNNGELANKLMHPSSGIDREYLVRVQGEVSKEQLQQLRDGIALEDGLAKFTDITIGGGKSTNTWYYCTLMEGKNREVRRLWESQGCRVSRLKRVRYGQVFIPSFVRMGQWLELGREELAALCTAAGIRPPRKKSSTRDENVQQERRVKRLRASPGKPAAKTSRALKSAEERQAFLAKKGISTGPRSTESNAHSGKPLQVSPRPGAENSRHSDSSRPKGPFEQRDQVSGEKTRQRTPAKAKTRQGTAASTSGPKKSRSEAAKPAKPGRAKPKRFEE